MLEGDKLAHPAGVRFVMSVYMGMAIFLGLGPWLADGRLWMACSFGAGVHGGGGVAITWERRFGAIWILQLVGVWLKCRTV